MITHVRAKRCVYNMLYACSSRRSIVCQAASFVVESDDDEVLNACSQSSDHSVLNGAPGRRRTRARVESRLRSEPATVAEEHRHKFLHIPLDRQRAWLASQGLLAAL